MRYAVIPVIFLLSGCGVTIQHTSSSLGCGNGASAPTLFIGEISRLIGEGAETLLDEAGTEVVAGSHEESVTYKKKVRGDRVKTKTCHHRKTTTVRR